MQKRVQIKKFPVACFSQRVIHTYRHIPKTFQLKIPNVTSQDTSRKSPSAYGAQIDVCFTERIGGVLIDSLLIPILGVIHLQIISCSWNVLESRQTTVVVWFYYYILQTKTT